VQLYVDGFGRLPLKEKILLWHLYQAALAGRDIYYDQRYAHGLEMRDVLEEIITHPGAVDPATLAEIQRYTKLFWLNCGPYNNLTARKFVLKCTPDAFAAAARAAAAAGARFPLRAGESLPDLLRRLEPLFFDPALDPSVTNKTPGPGRDILASSANNLYVGVTMKDLEGFEEKYPLNSRLVRRDGVLVEEVYRIGGRYDREIRRIVQHLEEALPYATPAMADALRPLLSHRRRRRSRRLRHRVGEGPGFAGRHDQRVRRGVHGPARPQGRVGGARLLRQSGKNGGHPPPRRRRAVVRGPHALGG
jgi:dipeptidyl-peptidase-3